MKTAPVIILLLVSSSCLRAADDWPQWRGANRDGRATTNAAPVSWSETKNIVWKAAVPGRGQSDPTVVGSHVFLTTADENTQIQSLLCFDRQSGKPLWKTDVHKGGFEKEKHDKCSDAVSTVACDGQRIFAVFLNQKAIWVTAFDLKGKKIWQKQVSKFNSKFGYGASPLLYKSYLIVASDNQGGGTLTALDRKSGNVVWNTQRQAAPTYSSPAVATVAGKEQLLISGADRISSYDPGTGKLAWSCQGASIQTVNTMAFAGDLVYASGGFPTKETFCIRADGSAKVVWHEKGQISNVPSMLVHAGYLYLVTDEGIAFCRDATTGAVKWQQRLGGTFSASPVYAAGHIYTSNEAGKTFVFKADSKAFKSVAENQLGDEAFASSVICGNQLFLRVANSASGRRAETLYCIGSDE